MTQDGGPSRRSALVFNLMTVLAVAVCVLAAWWQWQRAHRTTDDAVPSTPAVAWSQFDPQASYSGQRLQISGRFLPEQIMVVPRERAGAPGAWVLSALVPDDQPSAGAPAGAPAAVAVVRGWVPQGVTAEQVATPAGEVEVTGVLVADERRPGAPGEVVGESTRVDSGQLALAVGRPTRAGWLALTAVAPADGAGGGVQPIPLEVGELPGADVGLNWRNAAYALQWLVFAAFAVFFWNRFRRDYFAAQGDRRPTAGSTAGDGQEQELIR